MYTNKYIKKQIEIVTKRKYERLIRGMIALLLIFIAQLVQRPFNFYSMVIIAGACILALHELEIIAIVNFMKSDQYDLSKGDQ